jgi:hypothetical protein
MATKNQKAFAARLRDVFKVSLTFENRVRRIIKENGAGDGNRTRITNLGI